MTNNYWSKRWTEFTILLMVLELTYINSKSIYYLIEGMLMVDSVFAVIGSMAYSTVTVKIMLETKSKFLKIAFPFFDTVLVFCGFNLMHAHDWYANPIRFYLSIFLAVFTGLITYSLGQINADEHSLNESRMKQDESKRIIEEQKRIIDDQKCIIDELTAKQIEQKRIVDESKKTVIESKRLANEFLQNHVLHLNWNNSKKKDANRNGHEAKISELAQKIKSGEPVTVDDYLK
jgi:hypothetical protein